MHSIRPASVTSPARLSSPALPAAICRSAYADAATTSAWSHGDAARTRVPVSALATRKPFAAGAMVDAKGVRPRGNPT